jgi:hypothetical protein
VSPAPAAASFKQNASSSAANSNHSVSTRVEREAAASASGDRDRRVIVIGSSRRDKAPPPALVAECKTSEALDSNTSEMSAAVATAVTPEAAAVTVDAMDADSSSEVAVLSSLQEAVAVGAASEAQECLKEEEVDDGSPALVTWQARDAAALARQTHPYPLPQALFAPDITLPPQQAAALAGGAAPPKRQLTKPFQAFMEGLSALQCVSQSGVVSLDIERIFPLGPCNDSLR